MAVKSPMFQVPEPVTSTMSISIQAPLVAVLVEAATRIVQAVAKSTPVTVVVTAPLVMHIVLTKIVIQQCVAMVLVAPTVIDLAEQKANQRKWQ